MFSFRRQFRFETVRLAFLFVICLLYQLPNARIAIATVLNPGDILIADANAFGGTGGIIRVDPVTGAQTTVSSGGSFSDPSGIVIDATGSILIADMDAFGGTGGIIRVDPLTGIQSTVSSGGSFSDPFGIAIDANGQLLVTDRTAFGGNGGVIRVDPATGVQTTVSSGGNFLFPFGIALDANGDIIVADANALDGGCGTGCGAIIRINPISGAQTIVSAGGNFEDPIGVTIDANGDIIVADASAFPSTIPFSGAIFRVDPVTGTQTTISAGGSFVDPYAIAIDGNGSLLLVDTSAFPGTGGGVIRVDPATGSQTTVSQFGSFHNPFGIALVPLAAPVPEAPSLVLLGGGLMGLAGFSCKRRRH